MDMEIFERMAAAIEAVAERGAEIVAFVEEMNRTAERHLGSLREIEALLREEWREGER